MVTLITDPVSQKSTGFFIFCIEGRPGRFQVLTEYYYLEVKWL
jgi:hypothetical protein